MTFMSSSMVGNAVSTIARTAVNKTPGLVISIRVIGRDTKMCTAGATSLVYTILSPGLTSLFLGRILVVLLRFRRMTSLHWRMRRMVQQSGRTSLVLLATTALRLPAFPVVLLLDGHSLTSLNPPLKYSISLRPSFPLPSHVLASSALTRAAKSSGQQLPMGALKQLGRIPPGSSSTPTTTPTTSALMSYAVLGAIQLLWMAPILTLCRKLKITQAPSEYSACSTLKLQSSSMPGWQDLLRF